MNEYMNGLNTFNACVNECMNGWIDTRRNAWITVYELRGKLWLNEWMHRWMNK